MFPDESAVASSGPSGRALVECVLFRAEEGNVVDVLTTQLGRARRGKAGESCSWHTSAGWPFSNAKHVLHCYKQYANAAMRGHLPALRIPNPHSRIQAAARNTNTIIGNGVDLMQMPPQNMDAFTRVHVPKLRGEV